MTAERIYQGRRGPDGIIVEVEGVPLPLSKFGKELSPTGFGYGYDGLGPAALAHSILVYEFTPDYGLEGAEQIANEYYQEFKQAALAPLKDNTWHLRSTWVRFWCGAVAVPPQRPVLLDEDSPFWKALEE